MGPILDQTKVYCGQQICIELLSQVPLVTFAFRPCRTRFFVRNAFARLLNWTGTLEAIFNRCNYGYVWEGRVSGHATINLFRSFSGCWCGKGKATSNDHENETVSMKIEKMYAKVYQISEQ